MLRRGRPRNVLLVALAALATPAAASAAITGTAFRDYDADGTRDGREPGLSGIAVRALNDAGSVVATTTTAGDGTYSLTGIAAGARVRIEFAGQAAFMQQGGNGLGAGSSAQFATEGADNVNHGLNNPAEFCEANPQIAAACSFYGRFDSTFGAKGGVRVFGYDTNGFASERNDAPTAIGDPALAPTAATFAKVGSTYGLAYQRESRSLFAAAFYKRGSGFGPAGPGGIYRITSGADNQFGTADDVTSTFLDLGADAGPDLHPTAVSTDPLWIDDVNSWSPVGKSSLGDIDVSDDGTTLYAMNLNNRKLYIAPIGTTPTAPAAAQIRQVDMPDPGADCVADAATPAGQLNLNVRPFAVGYQDGHAYVGLTCTGQSTGLLSDVKAFVYRFDDPGFTRVLEQPLSFTRSGSDMPWYAWTDATTGGAVNDWAYGEPMLADLEWDGEDLVLGIRDRRGDQTGYGLGAFNGGTNFNAATGDILRACRADAGTEGYLMESNGSSPAGCRRPFGPGAGATNTQGPGGGEFYVDGAVGFHDDVAMGGLAQVPGSTDIIASLMDPNQTSNAVGYVNSNGVRRMSNVNGAAGNALELTANCVGPLFDCQSSSEGGFGKANGIGDLEALCGLAPIEIGNRVWLDDGDGVQDPSETPAAGVTVRLFDAAGSVVATTTTDAEGRYLFSSAGPDLVPGNADDLGGFGTDGLPNTADDNTGLKPGQTYSVRLDNPADYTGAGALAGRVPTARDVTAASGTTINDSNGVRSSATDTRAGVTTAAAGHNNHTLDFGFALPARLGDRVWYDNNKNGIQDAGETGVNGVRVILRDTTGNEIARTTTDSAGNYLFNNLSPGSYVVVFDTTTLPAGYVVTSQNAAGAGGANGSDANPTTGSTITITLVAGQSDLDWDMGISLGTVAAARLNLTKVANVRRARPNQVVTYTIRVRNTGTVAASNLSVCDRLPAKMTFASIPSGSRLVKGALCFRVTTLAAGASRTFTVKARVQRSARPGNLTNTVTLTGTNVSTTLRATARIRVFGAVAGVGVPGVTG